MKRQNVLLVFNCSVSMTNALLILRNLFVTPMNVSVFDYLEALLVRYIKCVLYILAKWKDGV
jgi:hypothetical protein